MIELSMLLKITSKCLSLRVVLDLLDQIFERSRHVIVSLQNVAILECWSQCSPRRLYGWNSLSALNDAVSRCSAGTNSSTVCACTWFHRFPCSIVSMHDANVFRQSLRFPRSIWRSKFFVQTLFIDLLWTGRFSFIDKNTFCVLRFPRSVTDWIGFGLGWIWRVWHEVLLQKTVEWVFQLASRIDVHEVFPSWWHTQGLKKGPSNIWQIFD